tara:strand:- start:63 stop:272 length:210 start_codon:yes stop_codon:yes gene_type:complete
MRELTTAQMDRALLLFFLLVLAVCTSIAYAVNRESCPCDSKESKPNVLHQEISGAQLEGLPTGTTFNYS